MQNILSVNFDCLWCPFWDMYMISKEGVRVDLQRLRRLRIIGQLGLSSWSRFVVLWDWLVIYAGSWKDLHLLLLIWPVWLWKSYPSFGLRNIKRAFKSSRLFHFLFYFYRNSLIEDWRKKWLENNVLKAGAWGETFYAAQSGV